MQEWPNFYQNGFFFVVTYFVLWKCFLVLSPNPGIWMPSVRVINDMLISCLLLISHMRSVWFLKGRWNVFFCGPTCKYMFVGKDRVLVCFLLGSEVMKFVVILSSCFSIFVSVSCLICATEKLVALLAQVQSLAVSGNHMTKVESQKVCRTSAAHLHNCF